MKHSSVKLNNMFLKKSSSSRPVTTLFSVFYRSALPRIKHPPVAIASDMKVSFFAPMSFIRLVAKREARRKSARHIVNYEETSNDLRDLNKAKKGITKVTSRNPMPRAKNARKARLLRKAIKGTWL